MRGGVVGGKIAPRPPGEDGGLFGAFSNDSGGSDGCDGAESDGLVDGKAAPGGEGVAE